MPSEIIVNNGIFELNPTVLNIKIVMRRFSVAYFVVGGA